jgi:hypothetical protein
LNIFDSKVQVWKLEKFDDAIEFENLELIVETKEGLNKHLLYFRTCMKLELDRQINDCDSSYIEALLEKKVYVQRNKIK